MSLLAVIVFAGVVTWVLQRRFPAHARSMVIGSAVSHLAAVVAQVYLIENVYRDGDMIGYFQIGEVIARAINANVSHLWNTVLFLAQQPHQLPFQTTGDASTGSMQALSGLATWAAGDDIYAVAAIFAAGALFGKALLALAFVRELPEPWSRHVAIGCLLMPSAVFWTSGIVKESVAVAGLGALAFAAHLIAHRRHVIVSVTVVALAGFLVAMVKPYVLMSFIAAAAVFGYRHLALRSRIPVARPAYLAVAAVAAYFGLVAIGAAFPVLRLTLSVMRSHACRRWAKMLWEARPSTPALPFKAS